MSKQLNSDFILDNMEACINNILPIYSVETVTSTGEKKSFSPKKKLPESPFFVQIKSFLGCGHFAFCTIVDTETWTLFAFCMSWIRQEIDKGRLNEVKKENLEGGKYAILRNRNKLIRGMVTQLEPLSILDLDQGTDSIITEGSKFYEMPQEAFSVPLMSLQIQIDKTQNFSSTDLVYQAFKKAKMQNAIFSAIPQKAVSKEFDTLILLTPQRENLGDILIKEMSELLEVPIPTVRTLIAITHYTDSGHVFYQIPAHFPQVFKLIEDFDLLVKREIATIRALIPEYSNLREVRERLFKDKGKDLFAALYSQDGRWYRARVVDDYEKGDEEVHMIFVDYGNDELVKVKDLLLLDEFDSAAREMPAMARRMLLRNVQSIGEDMDELLEKYSDFKLRCVQINGEWMAEVTVNVEEDPQKPENWLLLSNLLR